jgi:hypothetical protein
MRHHSMYAKADLGALELARDRAAPTLTLTEPVAGDPYLSGIIAGLYFPETEAHGSPGAYSASQIATAPAVHRQAADRVLMAADLLHLDGARAPASWRGCRLVAPRADTVVADIELAPGGASVTNPSQAPVELRVRRFGPSGLALPLGNVAGRGTAGLAIPRDSSAVPWHLVAPGSAVLRVCPLLP